MEAVNLQHCTPVQRLGCNPEISLFLSPSTKRLDSSGTYERKSTNIFKKGRNNWQTAKFTAFD